MNKSYIITDLKYRLLTICKNEILGTLLLLVLISCNSKNITLTEIQAERDSLKHVIETPVTIQNISNDTLRIPSIELDNDAEKNNIHFSGKILTTGYFHHQEVWPTVGNEKWFGIFKDKNGYYISHTTIKPERVHDKIDDDPTLEKMTGWNINTTNTDSSLILISGLNYLENHRIEEIICSKNIIPGDSVKIQHKGNSYNFYATATNLNPSKQIDHYNIGNYKIFLKAKINGVEKTQLIVSNLRNDDALASILFIGDIDGDGILDILIDTTHHYNVSRPTLYLSKPADTDQILKIVGIHVSYGC